MTESQKRLDEARTIIKVGNISPGVAIQLGGIKAPRTDIVSYNIYITARNGSVTQIVRFRRIDGKWKKAEKIVVSGKMSKENVDPDFPRGNNGNVEW